MKDFLLINKPEGWTSFDAVAFLRKKIRVTNPDLKKIKIGHAGTLDPFATGLLIVGVGREATKKLAEFKNLPKTYEAIFRLGRRSDTDDKTGKITAGSDTIPERKEIESVLNFFSGRQNQVPPMFSAKKINGQRLYKLARKGKTVERRAAEIEIYSTKIIEYDYPFLKIEVNCSPGTYIRALARDVGDKLGTGAYCDSLKRTRIGEYRLADAVLPDDKSVLESY